MCALIGLFELDRAVEDLELAAGGAVDAAAVVLGPVCLLLSYGPRVALGMAPGISAFLGRLNPRLVGAAVLTSLTLLIGGAVWGLLPGSSSCKHYGVLGL